ncbi:MAG TPA: GH92 family glycosyl hydrolase [Patescibacteria group bacterium]|nr:GH92 family glycosyl hydrolase [Patescibacteria group bacterium]
MKVLISLIVLVVCWNGRPVCAAPDQSPVRLVDPFIGTGGHGHTYPGASMPFGMVQLSPDTRLTGWDGCSGYHYSDSLLYGFSHTHLSGTGCSDYGDILLVPTVGAVRLARGGDPDPDAGYCSRFRHDTEYASPGYYRVELDDYGVSAELTVTSRAGLHRYLFPETEEANIIVDLTHRDEVIESGLAIVGDSEIEGYRRSRAWAKDQRVYFSARFSRPFGAFGIAADDSFIAGARSVSGLNVKAYVRYRSDGREPILVAVGISGVGIEGARANREAEIGARGFDDIRREAERAWERALGKITIVGGTTEERRIFYTALYHAMLAPNVFMDVDGSYRGRDLAVHRADGFVNHTVFSLWDTYRAAHPLFTIIERERTVDCIKTFLVQYEQGGRLPVWELAGNETDCMIGYHAVSVIADACAKGIRGFDVGRAYSAMTHSADADLFGLDDYRTHGYIPADGDGESISKTLEYAYDDWCIAQVAGALGKEDDYRRYIRRAQYYKNIFDPASGFMRAKMNATWISPFDPAEVGFSYTEANAWQYSFYVPQDIEGLITLFGGNEAFSRKLDELFTTSSETSGRDQPDITGLIGQYAHGNEPSHHMAYLYAYAGMPWKTQQRVREIMSAMYSDRPDGLCGNEDCGQLSAWYVLGALGFYPVTPGSDVYAIGSPLFDAATMDVGEGRSFTVRARNASPDNVYIQAAFLNGEAYEKSFLRHGDIIRGGELMFEMGSTPNTAWGAGAGDRPRSAITDHPLLPVPSIEPAPRAFTGSAEIALGAAVNGARIHYTTDGSKPTDRSPVYVRPFTISASTTIRAFAALDGFPPSFSITGSFSKVPDGMAIELQEPYSPMYTAGGDLALIDRIRGGSDFRTGSWQGYHGVDLDATVDLGAVRAIETIATGFLHDINSWIFMPSEVEYSVSVDGTAFTVVARLENDVPQDERDVVVRDFRCDGLHARGRFVRVRARSIGVCPSWHEGAGHPAWLFADEIVLE